MTDIRPVDSWSSDFDVLSQTYVDDPFTIWDELRTSCPVAHTDRRGSTWLPTKYQDVVDLAHDIEHFSSLDITVIPTNRCFPMACRLSRPTRRCIPSPDGCSSRGSPTPRWRVTRP